ncbi:hypothetical protein O181_018423 [Austropuccinia psidii MF-1]|uniref:Uncharacterized protein n=1 Tax=Austropuccinia psidii MF-1 TaxID=1389203 RepID=A0A9Q3C926_9BASI|nr:hypothetical protein [Austropuccinia psidii MF-1]
MEHQKEVKADGGEEFGRELQEEVKRAGSIIRINTPYYLESQGMVKRGHKKLKDAFVRMDPNGKNNYQFFPLEDIISKKGTTGYYSFQLQSGHKAVLPIGIETNSDLSIEWNKISTKEAVLEAISIKIASKEDKILKEVERLRD